MKLYASTVCVGLLIIMFCDDKQKAPVVVEDFCQRAKIIRLTEKTIDALSRPELDQINIHNEKVRRCKK